jgi:hypothetical protein
MTDTAPPPPTTLGALVASLWTFAFTSLGVALMLLTGWLSDVAKWLTSDDEAVVFPDMAPLIKVAVAVGLAAVCAGVNFLYRRAQTNETLRRVFRGPAPTYTTVEPAPPAADQGHVDLELVLVMTAIAVLVVAAAAVLGLI